VKADNRVGIDFDTVMKRLPDPKATR